MPCKYFNNGGIGCAGCCHLVKSTAVAVAAGVLNITVPGQIVENHEKICLVIAQAIPNTITADTTVTVTVGTTAMPVTTQCGNKVYADQLCTRKVLHLYAATDVPGLVICPKELRCTNHVFPVLPATTA